MRILVIEDEMDLNDIITKQLRKNNYAVDNCFDGKEALDYIVGAKYDLILCDVMMPNISGFDFIEKLRKQGNDTPVIFLTAKDGISDKIEGLDLGASDYIVKPFSFEELFARIRVVVRNKSVDKQNILKIEDLTLDISSHEVKRGGKILELSAKEYAILKYMLMNKGIVLSREKIENHIWNYDYDGASNVIDVYIRYLRKKVDDDFDEKLIKTVRGAGYVLKGKE